MEQLSPFMLYWALHEFLIFDDTLVTTGQVLGTCLSIKSLVSPKCHSQSSLVYYKEYHEKFQFSNGSKESNKQE